MTKITHQMNMWSGSFGREYTNRNAQSKAEMEAMYKHYFGVTRTELNEQFLRGLDRSVRILEVGSNVGNQLLCLQSMGFHNLFGIDLQSYAVELAKSRTSHINLIEASAFDIPYKDDFFDLVFTSGVLIHLHPAAIAEAMQEIYRCSREFIWGYEYYADEYTEINYREHDSLLWKADFAKLYLALFGDLELIKEERLHYLSNDNVDSMFLLRKIR